MILRDMSQGPVAKQILIFSLPMLAGAIFQQLYNMADSIIVGQYVGPNALAAVGTSFPIVFFLISLVMGLTVGSGVIISQFFGAKQHEALRKAVSTAFLFQGIAAVVLSVVGILLSRPLLLLLRTPSDVINDSVAYMQIYFYGLIFLFAYNSFAGFLRSIGDSRTPLYFLIISTLINIALDIYFVAALGWGVRGVAWATLIAQAVSSILCAIYVYLRVPLLKVGRGQWIFDQGIFRTMLRIGIPSAVQQSVASMGFMAVQSLINSFGSVTMAANTAAARVDSFAMMPMMQLSMALSTFVGQNVGAGNLERVRKGLFSTMAMIAICASVLGFLVYTTGPQLIKVFIKAEEVDVIARGAEYLRIVSLFYIFFGIMATFNSALRGAGDTLVPMYTIIVDLGARVAVAYWLTTLPAISYRGAWWAIPVGWGVASIIPTTRFFSGAWKTKAVVKQQAVTTTATAALD